MGKRQYGLKEKADILRLAGVSAGLPPTNLCLVTHLISDLQEWARDGARALGTETSKDGVQGWRGRRDECKEQEHGKDEGESTLLSMSVLESLIL